MGDIYTRGGDTGSTSLPNGTRARKDDPLIELLGALDEANSAVGFARPVLIDPDLDTVLEFIQQRLFNCGVSVGGAKSSAPQGISSEDVAALERVIDRYAARAGSFDGFTLPGCDEASSRLHLARTALRRAERAAATVDASAPLEASALAFLNRASDMLYVAARFTSAGNECRWRPDAPRP